VDKVLRVLHIVANGKLSGAEKVVLDICTNLDREKFCPVAVCGEGELPGQYSRNGVETYVVDVSNLKFSEIRKLHSLIGEKNIDIVHGHDVKASIAGYLASRKFGKPVISHIHASYPWICNLGPLKIIDSIFRNRYSFTVACSKMAMEYYLQNNRKVDKSKVTYLNNCFNFNEFEKLETRNKDSLKREMGIKEGTFIYGFLGRLLEGKGADLMIESFNEIQKGKPEVLLLIVGDGPERGRLEEQVKKYEIGDKVIFAGFQRRPYDYMNLFDCFILPSVSEGLPIAVLEAMAMKKTVISTPVAGLKDLMKDGYNGIVLNKRTKAELMEAMDRIYGDKAYGEKLAVNAYNYLLQNYNINDYMKSLEKLYLDIIGE
jgi:glycosyltransferase involved in cell wall biosynthesis